MKKTLLIAGLFLVAATGKLWSQQGWIVGGQNSTEGQYPWIGDMRIFDTHLCGSSLIAPQWVLTAAHCCFGFTPGELADTNDISFRFNTVNTNAPVNPNGGLERNTARIFVHPLYDESEFFANGYDIAIIRLSQPVTSIVPISLPSLNDTAIVYATNYPVKIAGWGLSDTTQNFPNPDTMKFCSTRVFDHSLCSDMMGGVTSRSFCAGYKDGEEEAGAAAGDSGGPLWVENGSVKKLTGLVSGGMNPWTILNVPGVFTKVAMFRPWIDSIMQSFDAVPTATKELSWNEENIKVGMDNHNLRLFFGMTGASEVVCELYSLEGRKVYQTAIARPDYRNYTLDISDLTASMYVLRVYHPGNGKYYAKKIVKQ